MRLPVCRGEKRLYQRTDRYITLGILPSLSNDLAVFIQQEIRQIRIVEITRQQSCSRLCMKVLWHYARRHSALPGTNHKDDRR